MVANAQKDKTRHPTVAGFRRTHAVILHGGATGRHMLNTPNGNLKALTYAVA